MRVFVRLSNGRKHELNADEALREAGSEDVLRKWPIPTLSHRVDVWTTTKGVCIAASAIVEAWVK